MTYLFAKKYTTNLFIEIRKLLHNIITDEVFHLKDNKTYTRGLYKIIRVLSNALKKIEDIYFSDFLEPNLQKNTLSI